MRSAFKTIVGLCVLLGGCSTSTEQRSLGYGDYLAMSCDQLGDEALRLTSEAAGHSERIFENNEDERAMAALKLREIKQARAEKHC